MSPDRRRWLRSVGLLGAAAWLSPTSLHAQGARGVQPAPLADPLVIAHRGASGERPEHTLAAYALAIEQGADYIEPDLVITRDGVLVARHENALALLGPGGAVREATTDVAERPEFAARCTTKTIDGQRITGWFTEDFTLAELKTLRARERIPQLRPGNTRFDGLFEIPTFEEVLQLVDQANARRRLQAHDDARSPGRPVPFRPVGIYPETKHPSYFRGIGLPLEEPLVTLLDRHGYQAPDSPVFIQSFEVGNLRRLRQMTRVPLVQLLAARGQHYDFAADGDTRTSHDTAPP
ncbi:glycerophosphodiester phosphodiesterase family protein, partial [Caldimonas sp.]|uniref:glycerophosphodiester phosphodiesterase family protein n=1 Tax=Caldimonas sp. TaxID=2838790 RepID=UPI00391B7801